jgi:hypothetical protein
MARKERRTNCAQFTPTARTVLEIRGRCVLKPCLSRKCSRARSSLLGKVCTRSHLSLPFSAKASPTRTPYITCSDHTQPPPLSTFNMPNPDRARSLISSDKRPALSAGFGLVVDPPVRLLHPINELDGGSPVQSARDFSIVAIATTNAGRCIQPIATL